MNTRSVYVNGLRVGSDFVGKFRKTGSMGTPSMTMDISFDDFEKIKDKAKSILIDDYLDGRIVSKWIVKFPDDTDDRWHGLTTEVTDNGKKFIRIKIVKDGQAHYVRQ